ncbi:NRDE family protein [Thermomonas sp.]
MCLVALAFDNHPRWRIVLAGNRDESHARPTAPLASWDDAPILAGRDLASGGTWVGLDPKGRVAVVTNVRDGFPQPHQGPSRGALPVAFLAGTQDAETTTDALLDRAGDYAPFNLLLADATSCWHLGNHPRRLDQLAPGVHGISNGPIDAPWPKTRHLCAALEQWLDAGDDDLQPLWAALADERIAADDALPDTGVGLELERRLSAAFIRGETYGTRASTIVLVDRDGQGWIHERRFGPEGVFLGETRLSNRD